MPSKCSNIMISQEDMIILLDIIYNSCLKGIQNKLPSSEKMAEDFLARYVTKNEASKAFIRNHVKKSSSSTFLSGFEGAIQAPVSVPDNICCILFSKMRLIATIAYIGGYNLKTEQTRAVIYACLSGVGIKNVIQKMFLGQDVKVSGAIINRIPIVDVQLIRKKVAVKSIGLSKEFKSADMEIVLNRAFRWFMNGDYCSKEKNENVDEITKEELDI